MRASEGVFHFVPFFRMLQTSGGSFQGMAVSGFFAGCPLSGSMRFVTALHCALGLPEAEFCIIHFMNRCSLSCRICFSLPAFFLAVGLWQQLLAQADRSPPAIVDLHPVQVIAHAGESALQVEVDPRAPAQPLPSQDGADLLRAVPGVQVIRKGGTDGDPLLRGMAGSRLGILTDGEVCYGGCGNRMDPPTAYVHPALYDKVTVLKGPQSVSHGPGYSAGVVLFERSTQRPSTASWNTRGHATAASWGRRDAAWSTAWSDPLWDFDLSATVAQSGDYEDGSGRSVHSAYERWNVQARVGGWLSDENRLEWTATTGDGEAAYADRAMDGVAFKRQHSGLKWSHLSDEGRVREWGAQLFFHDVDHVMDNYTLRPFSPSAMMPGKAVSNPDRRTFGGKLHALLAPSEQSLLRIGTDYQENRHRIRKTSNQELLPYESNAFQRDAGFEVLGFYSEWEQELGSDTRVVGGLRWDRWQARDLRSHVAVGMGQMPNPTAGKVRKDGLPSAFLRMEQRFGRLNAYAGLGHSERFPDYWELFSKESAASVSAFDLAPEQTTQLDLGLGYDAGDLSLNLALFHGWIEDYILIQSQFPKAAAAMMGGKRMATISRNVDAISTGFEASAIWELSSRWRVEGSLAWVRGENTTESRPLAQQPPLEGRFTLLYRGLGWSMGTLLRLVAKQDRFALNQGNIVGQDLGASEGFESLSVFASWKPIEGCLLTAGVDNVLDATYAEHLSRGGSMVSGFPPPTLRLYEPGRTLWVRCAFEF
jgi:iron complex outermembrane receptor protein